MSACNNTYQGEIFGRIEFHLWNESCFYVMLFRQYSIFHVGFDIYTRFAFISCIDYWAMIFGFCWHYLGVFSKHRRLVHDFFSNASGMLRPNGEIHVNHKTSAPFSHWNLEKLASQNSLLLIECVPFNIHDYPGYNNKRGDGLRCDEPFRLGKCSTFKFIFSPESKKMSTNHTRRDSKENLPHQIQRILFQEHNHETSFVPNHPINLFSSHLGSPVRDRFREDVAWVFDWYFTHVDETFGVREEMEGYHVYEGVRRGYDRYVKLASCRTSPDFIVFLEELHGLSLMRIERLKQSLEDMSHY